MIRGGHLGFGGHFEFYDHGNCYVDVWKILSMPYISMCDFALIRLMGSELYKATWGLMPKGGLKDRFHKIAQRLLPSPRFGVPGLVRLGRKLRPPPLQRFVLRKITTGAGGRCTPWGAGHPMGVGHFQKVVQNHP